MELKHKTQTNLNEIQQAMLDMRCKFLVSTEVTANNVNAPTNEPEKVTGVKFENRE